MHSRWGIWVLFLVTLFFYGFVSGFNLFLGFDGPRSQPIVRNGEVDISFDGKLDWDDGLRGKAVDFYFKQGFVSLSVPGDWFEDIDTSGLSIGLFIFSRGLKKGDVILSSSPIEIRADDVFPDRIAVILHLEDGDREVVRIPVDIPKMEWVHLLVGIKGMRVVIYINDEKVVDDVLWNNKLSMDSDPIREKIYLGGYQGKVSYNGKIDEFCIFTDFLDDYEVAGLL